MLNEKHFTKEAYEDNGRFQIHPLSSEGLEAYLSKESYNYHYLKSKYDPILLKQIEDEVNEERFTENFKKNYPHRKETVEMIFGDCKEQHGLRFTRLRGLEKNSNQVLLIFACHNLKKMGLWKWKTRKKASKNAHYLSIIRKLLKIFQKKAVYFFKYTTLSTN